MNIIILQDSDLIADNKYELTDIRAEHIISILKLTPGDTIEIGHLNKFSGIAEILSVDNHKVTIEERESKKFVAPPIEQDIIVALPRPQILKRVLFISAMMGVRKLYLIKSNRVEKSYFQSPALEDANLERVMIEGLCQGKNIRLPQVSIHDKFKVFIEDTLRVLESNEKVNPVKLLPELIATKNLNKIDLDKSTERYLSAIGPEGGWVPFEIDKFIECGFVPCKLSRHNLRVDSALTSLLSQLELLTS